MTITIVQKVVHVLSNRAKQLRDHTNLSFSGNTDVWAKSSYAKLWRHIGSRRVRVMKKSDESKAKWIILQKRKGGTTSSIAKTMNISTRWVKKLWTGYRYADPDRIVYPVPTLKNVCEFFLHYKLISANCAQCGRRIGQA